MGAVLPIPLSIIGGFLGSGKTTLLNRLLVDADGVRFAVLVNDFGAINIDAGLIEEACDSVIKLANGCVCCSIGDNLLGSLLDILDGEPLPDHILIEASGVADPARVAEMTQLESRLRLDGVIVLVDAERILKQLADERLEDTAVRQLQSADILVLNKWDCVDAETRRRVRDRLANAYPDAGLIDATYGQVPMQALFGTRLDRLPPLPAPSQGEAGDHGHDPAHPFWSIAFELEGLLDETRSREFLASLPESLIRAKGILILGEDGKPHVFQRVATRWELTEAGHLGPQSASRLVLLGVGDPPGEAAIRERLAGCLDQSAS